MKNPIRPPPVTSFPFLRRGRNLLSMWVQALEAQSNLWNDQWTKLREGTYEPKDWFSAVANGTELTAATLEAMWLELVGDPSPPWHSLSWDSKDEGLVQLRIGLERNGEGTVSKVSIVGKEPYDPNKILPELAVTRVRANPTAIKLWLENAGDERIHQGQYSAIVMRGSHHQTEAIETATRAEARGRSRGEEPRPGARH